MLDKFTKEYTFGNINEFYDGLEASPNSKIAKFRVWCNYYTEVQRQKECDEIATAYKNRTRGYYTCGKVTDNIFVVTRNFTDGQKSYYLPCIKKDGIVTRYNVAFDTFDQAVIAAYNYLYTGDEDAGHWAYKLMDIK